MRKIILLFSLTVFYMFTITFISCKHDPIDQATIKKNTNDTIITPPPSEICFQDQILPIIQSNCAKSGCHDAITAEENLILTSYNSIRNIITANNPSNSKLFEVITANPGSEKFMPPAPNAPLTTEQKALIYAWIMQGGKNTTCPTNCDTNIFTFSGAVLPTIQQKCMGCHSGTTPNGNLSLQNYTQIVNAVNLYTRITSITTPMPPTGLMDACKIRQIKKWIDAGKLNN